MTRLYSRRPLTASVVPLPLLLLMLLLLLLLTARTGGAKATVNAVGGGGGGTFSLSLLAHVEKESPPQLVSDPSDGARR